MVSSGLEILQKNFLGENEFLLGICQAESIEGWRAELPLSWVCAGVYWLFPVQRLSIGVLWVVEADYCWEFEEEIPLGFEGASPLERLSILQQFDFCGSMTCGFSLRFFYVFLDWV